MAITFKCYTTSALDIEADITLAVIAESDLSEGAHDFQFFFGSTETTKMLRTITSPGVNNVILTPAYILPSWIALTAYALDYSVIPATPNGYRYVVTTAGTSGASAPTWGTLLGGTTTEGSVTWTLVAEDSPTSEVKIAATQAGLTAATGGAAFNLGTTLLSGSANAVEFWVRVTNTITQVSSSLGTPELGITLNPVSETPSV